MPTFTDSKGRKYDADAWLKGALGNAEKEGVILSDESFSNLFHAYEEACVTTRFEADGKDRNEVTRALRALNIDPSSSEGKQRTKEELTRRVREVANRVHARLLAAVDLQQGRRSDYEVTSAADDAYENAELWQIRLDRFRSTQARQQLHDEVLDAYYKAMSNGDASKLLIAKKAIAEYPELFPEIS